MRSAKIRFGISKAKISLIFYATIFSVLKTVKLQAESSVLPPAVSDANFPNDIYPISLFVSEEEIAELGQLGMEFLQTGKKELKSRGNSYSLIEALFEFLSRRTCNLIHLKPDFIYILISLLFLSNLKERYLQFAFNFYSHKIMIGE